MLLSLEVRMKLSGRDGQLEEKRADVNMHELCINQKRIIAHDTAAPA
jgi:hypothetical protein